MRKDEDGIPYGINADQMERMDQLVVEAKIRPPVWEDWALGQGNWQRNFLVLVAAVKAGRNIQIVKSNPTYNPITDVYTFDVNFLMSWDQVVDEGSYDIRYLKDRFFRPEGEGLVEMEGKIFVFDHDIRSDAVEEKMRNTNPSRPWKPSGMYTLLSFGAAFPDILKLSRLVGLKSPFQTQKNPKRELTEEQEEAVTVVNTIVFQSKSVFLESRRQLWRGDNPRPKFLGVRPRYGKG